MKDLNQGVELLADCRLDAKGAPRGLHLRSEPDGDKAVHNALGDRPTDGDLVIKGGLLISQRAAPLGLTYAR